MLGSSRTRLTLGFLAAAGLDLVDGDQDSECFTSARPLQRPRRHRMSPYLHAKPPVKRASTASSPASNAIDRKKRSITPAEETQKLTAEPNVEQDRRQVAQRRGGEHA